MGENAFIAYTVVKGMGYSWQTALGSIFIAGALFTLLTLLKIRGWLAEAIPLSLKYSFAVGIGIFLSFLGFVETGMVTLGVPGAPVALGRINSPPVLIAMAGFVVTVWLIIRKVKGALIIGILCATMLSLLFGTISLPATFVSLPPSLAPVFLKLDLSSALTLKALPVVFIVFVMAFVDTVGTLIGLSARAGLLDSEGNMPDMEKPMLADALANMAAPLLGTTTSGAYIESAAGIEEGGRTGFTAVVVALLFLLSLFFAPLFTAIPPHAYGVALIVIGIFMIEPIRKIPFDDYTELVPAFLTIVLISFTFNIGVGITAGLISYPLMKTVSGRIREVPPPLWILAAMSLAFYLVYPYK
jgi:AGZA family xanthine/uracil permease-like MFS transporter